MEEASDMAVALTGRAADMASFYNKTAEETATALKSIYTGETETLKEYGVVMTEVNLQEYAYQQGIRKKLAVMTQAEKVQLRYNYVMEQTALAAGDFARTSDSWANQTRILKEQFKELLSVMGTGLITVLTPVVKFLNTILTQLIAIAKQIGAVLSRLLGISIPTADSGKFVQDLTDAAGGADALAEGIGAAEKAANKALAPFDKLNVLSQNGGGKGGGAGAGGFEMPDLEMDESEVSEADELSSALDNVLRSLKPVFDWFKKLKDLFVKGFFDGLGESWKDRVNEIAADAKNIVRTLKEIFTDPAVVAAAQTMIEKIAYALGQVIGSIVSIGITIAQNLVGGIDKYLTQNKEFLKQKLISIFDITGDIALLIGEACAAIAYIFEAFGSENGQQLTANIIGIFNNTILSLLELALEFGRDILGCIIQPIVDNKEELRVALDGLLGVFADVSGTVLQSIDDTFSKIGEVYDKYIKPTFDSFAQGYSELLTQFLDFWNGHVQPILTLMAEMFDTLWTEHLQPLVNNIIEWLGLLVEQGTVFFETVLQPVVSWLIDNLLPVVVDTLYNIWDAVTTVIGYIADIINGIIEVVNGVMKTLNGIARGDWKEVWEGFLDVIRGVRDTIKGIINAILDFIEFMVNNFVDSLNTMLNGLEKLATINNPITGQTVWQLSIPDIPKLSIPHLADGAVIRGGDPFMAVLGDQRHGQTNIETPLPTMVKAFKQAMAESGGMGGGEYTFVAQIDGRTIFEETVRQDCLYRNRTGRSRFAY